MIILSKPSFPPPSLKPQSKTSVTQLLGERVIKQERQAAVNASSAYSALFHLDCHTQLTEHVQASDLTLNSDAPAPA